MGLLHLLHLIRLLSLLVKSNAFRITLSTSICCRLTCGRSYWWLLTSCHASKIPRLPCWNLSLRGSLIVLPDLLSLIWNHSSVLISSNLPLIILISTGSIMILLPRSISLIFHYRLYVALWLCVTLLNDCRCLSCIVSLYLFNRVLLVRSFLLLYETCFL